MILPISGWSVISSAGIGRKILADRLSRESNGSTELGYPVQGLYPDTLPTPNGHAMLDFDVRQILGRKGTSFLDRRSALAMVACGQALEASGVQVDDSNRSRIGIVLGTTLGSLKSMNDYTRETLVEDRPYLVNPVLFPNTVMNCAAGQAAIRFGLKGVNATLAGGDLAFLNVLRYSTNLLRCGYADLLLMGSVEEFTPHSAWAAHLVKPSGPHVPQGEGVAVFVTHRNRSGPIEDKVEAEVLSVEIGFAPSGDGPSGIARALERCIRRVLNNAGVAAGEVFMVATMEIPGSDDNTVEAQALSAIFGKKTPSRLMIKKLFGDCQAATGALQLAALLTLHEDNAKLAGRTSLLLGWTADGGVGAAVLKGRSRVGSDHR